MLKTIVLIVALVIAAVLIYATTKPDTFQVQRSLVIQAAPDKLFALINSLQRMTSWSPYEKADPAMKRTFSGPESGPGATYEWQGNSQAGEGRIAIIDNAAPTRVTMKLDMFKPIEGHNTVNFTLEPQGSGTRVNWHMQGASTFLSKLLVTLGIMDKMVGGQFEEGLNNLKRIAESG